MATINLPLCACPKLDLILCGPTAPDGTDNLPYHIRDLGTIFFIQAAAEYLEFYREDK